MMAMRMEDLPGMDVSDVASGGRLAPVAPGDVLRHEFMEPMGLSANALAGVLKVPANRVTGILNGTRNITADTALRLQAAFGVSASFWLGLQSSYNLERAEAESGAAIVEEVSRLAA